MAVTNRRSCRGDSAFNNRDYRMSRLQEGSPGFLIRAVRRQVLRHLVARSPGHKDCLQRLICLILTFHASIIDTEITAYVLS
jgi:hypothetical protein